VSPIVVNGTVVAILVSDIAFGETAVAISAKGTAVNGTFITNLKREKVFCGTVKAIPVGYTALNGTAIAFPEQKNPSTEQGLFFQ
jgi:hypothetical protein